MSVASEPVELAALADYFGEAQEGEAAAVEGGGEEAVVEAAQAEERHAAEEDEAWGEQGLGGSAESAGEEEEEEAALETAREGGGRGRARGRGRAAAGTGAKRRKRVGAAASRQNYGMKHWHLIASVMRRMSLRTSAPFFVAPEQVCLRARARAVRRRARCSEFFSYVETIGAVIYTGSRAAPNHFSRTLLLSAHGSLPRLSRSWEVFYSSQTLQLSPGL